MAGMGGRVRDVRKRRGLSQRELATAAGVSLSTVKKIEQGTYGGVRLETAHKLAIVLRVPTSALVTEPDAPVPSPQAVQRWEPVRLALEGAPGGQPDGEPTLEGIRSAFADVVASLLAGRFSEVGAVLPALLRDTDALVSVSANGGRTAARSLRAQVRQVAGSLMLHTWQFETAGRAFDMAMADASDPLTAMSVVDERCWGLIRQGRLTETRELAFRWAAENEPKMSAATPDQMAQWGRLLVRAAMAAVRDNRPDEAAEALKLARMAAIGAGPDFTLSHSWHVFGPMTVSVFAAEHAMIADRPEVVLTIGHRLESASAAVPVLRHSPSLRLDVANAHATLREYAEAVGVLQQLRRDRPQWLPQQRYAADILAKIVKGRRTLTADMRELADAVRLPL